MHKTDIVAAVADQADLSKEKAGDVVNAILDQVTNALARGEAVNLIGFGSFSQRHRAARTGRSPKTGASIEIAASNSVGFKAGKALKDAVNKGTSK
ncbi:MAG: HU family DNA-binding protein [Cellvibrionaceae bacterium]|nr:HU family DNA-binding protein [Cellvibrionaceae bacterium]MCV6624941.1 HU family DNA-binding protein [Cellvibrionaceae bacterium]